MKTIKIVPFIIFSVFILSCDRSGIFEEFQKATPWEYHVQAFNDENMTQPVADVRVSIYKTSPDRDNNTNVLVTRNTGADGEAVFTLKDFDPGLDAQEAKGIYYMRAEKDGIVKNDITTRYLLMNDGHTYHYIVLN